MTAFYEGKYDILLSTAIVESGLDVPNANTLIVHRSDMFGLAQLYQLRGRVGRSKTRAYAYITTPPGQKLTEGADKRLKVLQSLDTLGAGFSLASHDLDIRGAGNLLGDEQSGHIREVGFELYQSMLEEAVAAMKGGDLGGRRQVESRKSSSAPSIMIPETYVSDLQLRLGLYRRLSGLEKREEIDAFAAELVDRFGPLPPEVEHLLMSWRSRVSAAPPVSRRSTQARRAVWSLSTSRRFANPEGLVALVQNSRGASQGPARSAARLSCRLGFAGGAAERCAGADPAVRRSCRRRRSRRRSKQRHGRPPRRPSRVKSRISPFGHWMAGSSPAMEGREAFMPPSTAANFKYFFLRSSPRAPCAALCRWPYAESDRRRTTSRGTL